MTVGEFRRRFKGANKFSARAVVEDHMRFDSKLERDRYLHWRQMRAAGVIDFFLRQVPFHLPGGIVYRLDFLIRWPPAYTAEPVTYEDCKGVLTRVSQNKIIQVQALYGIEVRLIKKGEQWS